MRKARVMVGAGTGVEWPARHGPDGPGGAVSRPAWGILAPTFTLKPAINPQRAQPSSEGGQSQQVKKRRQIRAADSCNAPVRLLRSGMVESVPPFTHCLGAGRTVAPLPRGRAWPRGSSDGQALSFVRVPLRAGRGAGL